jgi:hypothetical protein
MSQSIIARVTGRHHAAGNAHDVTGGRIGRQVRVGGADLRQCVGPPDFDGVGVAALGRQTSPFVPADPELLGNVCIAVAHDLPA